MSTARTLTHACTLLFAACAAFAVAQPVTAIERPAFDARFDVPTSWVGEVVDATADDETLTFTAPGDAGLVVVVLGRLSDEDRAELAGVGPEGVWDAWEGFAANSPDLRPVRESVRTVGGIEAGVLDYVGEGRSGSVVGAFAGTIGLTIVSIAFDGGAAEVGAGLETILATFAFGSGGAADVDAAVGNPLAPPAGASSDRNPLAPPPPDASASVPVSAASYHEPFAGSDPGSVFLGVLDIGSDGTWDASLTGMAYRLTNEVDPGAVRYYYLTSVPGESGPLAQGTTGVTLGMAPGGGGLSAAGLLFDFDPNDGTYLAFALTTTGYVLLQRSSTGLELLVDEDLDSLRPDGRNRLELRAAGASVEVVVNGETAATLNAELPFDGGVGIVAIGGGAFEFQDFAYGRP